MIKMILKILALPFLLCFLAIELMIYLVTACVSVFVGFFGIMFLILFLTALLLGGTVYMSWWEILGVFIVACIWVIIPDALYHINWLISKLRRQFWCYIKEA